MVIPCPIVPFSHCSLLELSLTLHRSIQRRESEVVTMAENGKKANLAVEDDFPAGIRVLVIDDDRASLQVVCSMLERCGYKVTKCTSGKEGLEMLRQEGQFDIVLTDVHMPDMDGFQLLEQVGLEMDLPVVMLSVDSSPETVVKGLKHGACDYLIKPVQREELEKIGEHVLTWRRANAGIFDD